MDYFIDGDFEIPRTYQVEGNRYYSSSHCSTKSDYVSIQPSPDIEKEISNSTFREIIDFYNEKESDFLSFERKTGINIWFFEQFRLYFSFRHFLLRVASIKSFIDKMPGGRILTSDLKLKYLVDEKYLEFVTAPAKPKENSILSEVWFMLTHYKFSYRQKQTQLIISRIEDDFEGIDQRFGTLQDDCDKIMNRDVFNSSKVLPDHKGKYYERYNVDTLFIRELLSVKSIFAIFAFKKNLKQLFQKINNTHQNVHPHKTLISALFRKNELSYLVYYLKYKSFSRFFKKTSYHSVIYINENSAQQKAIQYAAFEHNVKVYALQHGAIYDLHPAYMFGHYNTPPPLPTITFTWGNYFTRLLTEKGGYNKNQVVTSGRITRGNIIRQKHKAISSTKKEIIVYATQPQPNQSLRAMELHDVLVAAKRLVDRYLLVIRPHPAEKDNLFFDEIAKSVQFNEFIIDRVSDLQTQFESCVLLITSYSTVGAEFVPFYKPLLVLDYLKADVVNYIDKGVGIPVYNGEELVETLNKQSLKVNENSYETFIDDYFYENGNRAIEIIRNESLKSHN